MWNCRSAGKLIILIRCETWEDIFETDQDPVKKNYYTDHIKYLGLAKNKLKHRIENNLMFAKSKVNLQREYLCKLDTVAIQRACQMIGHTVPKIRAGNSLI